MLDNIVFCPLCGSKLIDYEIIAGRKIYTCSECSLQYTPDVVQMIKKDEYFDARSKDTDMVDKRRLQYEIDAKHFLSYLKNGSILDVGCSNGEFIKTINSLSSNNFDFVGIDVDFGAINNACINQKTSNMNFVCSDLLGIGFDKKFDVVIFRGTLHFLGDDLMKSFNKTSSILKSGGYVFIYCCPNFHSFLYYILKEKWIFFSPQIKLMFNETAVRNLAERNGFEICELTYPYIGTPYESREEDFAKIVDIINGKEVGSCPAFWGNVMQIVLKKV